MTFKVDVSGHGGLQAAINQMAGNVQAMDRVMPSIAELLVGAVNDVVDMEGPGWPSLAPETLMRRRKQGRGAKMLRDTNTMMGSLSPGHGSDYAEVSFGVDYAIYHIEGKRNPFDLKPVEEGLIADVTAIVLEQI